MSGILPPPQPRVGPIPDVRLGQALSLKRSLNDRAGFRECGLFAIVTIVRGGFGVHIFHPVGEPIDTMPRRIDGVPIQVGQVPVRRPSR